jgi:hypothetical protein
VTGSDKKGDSSGDGTGVTKEIRDKRLDKV